MKKHIVFMLGIVLGLSSCKNNNPPSTHTTVDGYVVERGSGKPIAGAQAILVKNTGGIGSSNIEAIGSIKSADNGYYKFEFEASSGTGYGVEAMDNRYDPWTYPYIEIQPSVQNHKNITLYPPAWLKIHAINPGTHHIIINSVASFNNLDTTIYSTVSGNGNTYLTYSIVNGSTGNYKTIMDTIYCKGFDTTTFTINIPK